MRLIKVTCPNCSHVMALFDEADLAANKTIRRAYEHMLRDPVLCGHCKTWVQVPQAPNLPAATSEDTPA